MIKQKNTFVNRLSGSVALITIMFSASTLNAGQAKQHKALAWATGKVKYDNIIPFVWIYRLSTPEKIKEQVDLQPQGYKSVFSWGLHCKYNPKQIKKLEKRTGKKYTPKQMSGINDNLDDNPAWWDNGVATVEKRFDQFFKKYHKLGGKVDYFILDLEKGMSNWHFRNKPEIFKQIAADPRFSELSKQLGFKDLEKVYKRSPGGYHLRWNALMKEREAAYINQATYDPIKKYYPNVKMSNYGYYFYRKQDELPDVNGSKVYKYGKGAIVGTAQAPALYCSFKNLKYFKFDGKNKYAKTPFNGFRYSLNRLRGATLASATKLMPWISNKAYTSNLVRESDLYQELIFHLGVTGVDTFLLWNPNRRINPTLGRDDVQDKLVSDCLHQLDEVITGDKRKTLIKGIVPWGADYALTGMQLKDSTIWRFTPIMRATEKISDFISIGKNKVILKTASAVIIISRGKIISPKKKLSGQGLWISAPLNTVPILRK